MDSKINRIPNIAKRAVAILLIVITLFSTLIIGVSANDSAFLETLIDTDKYVYVSNLVIDTANKNKKYAYKYVNMAYVMDDACEGDGLNNSDIMQNPNVCFRLNEGKTVNYGYKNTSSGVSSSDTSNGNLNLYVLMEGYFTKSGDSLIPITDDANKANALKGKEKSIYKKAKKKTSPLSYPGYYDEKVTTEQTEYAQQTHSTLVASLNAILMTVNDGKKFTSVSDLVNKSIMIRPDDANNVVYLAPKRTADPAYSGYVLVYADLTNINGAILKESHAGEAARRLDEITSTVKATDVTNSSAFLNRSDIKLPRASSSGALYCYVFPIDENDYLDFDNATMCAYAIPKGFVDIKCGNDNQHTFYSAEFRDSDGQHYDYTENQGDTPWISIHMLSMYANTVYKWEGLSMGTYTEDSDGNFFTQLIAGIFNGIMWAIKSLLQLTDIDVLVFNLDARGTAAYNYGLMSDNWWNVVLQYQLVFQAIAWVVLICGFIKTLISLNLSTINPQKRMSLYDTIQKFIVVGIGLVILIPVVQFMLECNDTIVELFASQIDTSSLNMPMVSNVIVQFIVGMMWITIMLYINFIYIMRSITVALLIASGPFFISTMAFSRSGSSSLFVSWAKELIANIFVQSVHAFVLSFLLQLLTTGKFLESFAIAISIIPLTEMFRNLIFAGAGGSTSQMATGAATLTQKGLHGLRQGATNAAVSLADGAGGGSKTQSESDKGPGGGGGGGSGGKSNVRDVVNRKNASRMDRIAQAAHSDKSKGQKVASIAGNAAMIGLNEMMAGMANAADIGEALQEYALTGDTKAFSQAMQNVGGGAVSGVGSAVKQGVQSHRDIKARQGTTTEANKTKPSDASRMGQSAVGEGGKTTAGAQVMATTSARSTELFAEPQQVNKVEDISGLSEAEQASAMQSYREGSNQTESHVVVDKGNGTYEVGSKMSWTDRSGQKQSCYMSKAATEKARATCEQADTSGQKIEASFEAGHGNQVAFGKKKETEDGESTVSKATGIHADVQNELVRSGHTGKFEHAIDDEGRKCLVGKYGNRKYAIPVDSNASAAEKASGLVDAARNGTGSLTMNGSEKEMARKYTENRAIGDDKICDMSNPQTTSDYSDAAVVSLAGKAVDGQSGVYEFGGQKFNTGMSREEARVFAKTVGISNVNTNGGAVTYTQSRASAGMVPTEVRHANGNTMAFYATGIGSKQAYAPVSLANDTNGGATLKFASRNDAEMYSRLHGDVAMAEAIQSQKPGAGLATFYQNSQDGSFEMRYDAKTLRDAGISIEGTKSGGNMIVSSKDGRVVNPFFASGDEPSRTDIGSLPPETTTATETNAETQ